MPQELSRAGRSEAGLELHDHIIICGLHNLSFRILEQLHASRIATVIVDDIPDVRLERLVSRLGIQIIREDSRHPEALKLAGLDRAAALIAAEDSDLHNLEIVLLTCDLVPGVRIVASFINPRIGQQLAGSLDNVIPLNLAEMAAPAFMEACRPTNILHLFRLGEAEIAIVEAATHRAGRLGELFGRAIPLQMAAPVSSGGLAGSVNKRRNWDILPQSECRIEPGQTLVLAGRVEDLKQLPEVNLAPADLSSIRAGLSAMQPDRPAGGRQNSKAGLRRRTALPWRKFVRTVLSDLERPFRLALLFVGLVIMTSSLLLWLFYRSSLTNSAGQPQDFSLLDALYFTVTIMTTVGFGDYTFAQQDWLLKFFGIGMLILGTASVAVLYAYVTNFIISRRIEQALGRQQADYLDKHVIICGLGSVGHQVMLGLIRQGRPVAVIEKNDSGRFNAQARSLGVPLIIGDSKLPQVLQSVNIKKAASIAILTSDDLANLETALAARAEYASSAARNTSKLRMVVRLFDQRLAERVANNLDIELTYSASALAAPYFVAAALNYRVVSAFYLERRPFVVARLVVEAGSRLAGLTSAGLFEAAGARVLALGRTSGPPQSGDHLQSEQDLVYFPSPATRLEPGRAVYLICPNQRVIEAYRLNRNDAP